MIYICDKCGKEFTSDPGYLSYGFKKGDPFICKICPECKKSLSPQDIDFLEKSKKFNTISEELGILGQ